MCGQVAVPVHHRQGEFDHLWVTSQDEIDEYRAGFTPAPSIDAELQRGSGHCIDFHLPSDDFQRSQLHFALATSNWLIQEQMRNAAPIWADILTQPLEFADGHAVPPPGPGLGTAINEAVAAAHPGTETEAQLSPRLPDGTLCDW